MLLLSLFSYLLNPPRFPQWSNVPSTQIPLRKLEEEDESEFLQIASPHQNKRKKNCCVPLFWWDCPVTRHRLEYSVLGMDG